MHGVMLEPWIHRSKNNGAYAKLRHGTIIKDNKMLILNLRIEKQRSAINVIGVDYNI